MATRSTPLLRRATWFAVQCAIAAAVAVAIIAAVSGPVQAQLDRSMLNIGARMLRFTAATHQDTVRTVTLNGARIHLSAGVTDQPVAAVTGFFAARCAPGGDLTRDLEALDSDSQPAAFTPPADSVGLGGAVRGGDDQHGFVACMEGATLGADSLAARARAFIRSGDARLMGSLRYVYAERRGVKTHFIAFSPTGPLILGELFPAASDAPGADLPAIPRPPDSRRLLSMQEDGYPQQSHIYGGGRLDVGQLAAFYERTLPAYGWELLSTAGRTERPDEAAIFAQRAGALAIISIGIDANGVNAAIVTDAQEHLDGRSRP